MRKMIFVIFTIALPILFGCDGGDGDMVSSPPSATFPLKKTGQTSSYIYPDDGYFQRGVTPSYTRDSETGIVTDNVTGLMWQDNVLSSSMQWETAIATCEDLSLGGYDDWRLPTIEEIESIIDYGHYDPAIDPIFVRTASNTYWSHTAHVNSFYAWRINFKNGFSSKDGKNGNNYVMCVRGTAYPDAEFVRDSATQIVLDKRTGLMWQDDELGVKSWGDAINYCFDKRLGGYRDWRLPNIREQLSIVDRGRSYPAIYPVFVHVGSGLNYHWSSTRVTNDDFLWIVKFSEGNSYGDRMPSYNYVRCVRAGQ
ncbi:DUF1566 domain-containing protein [Seleniivibrio woodruffii]|uniref:Lcl C-terminal domain-containing protein n=1 Tax=Seleniivibrio woodruffii TaxID=1078050 RepID=UPI0039E51B04